MDIERAGIELGGRATTGPGRFVLRPVEDEGGAASGPGKHTAGPQSVASRVAGIKSAWERFAAIPRVADLLPVSITEWAPYAELGLAVGEFGLATRVSPGRLFKELELTEHETRALRWPKTQRDLRLIRRGFAPERSRTLAHTIAALLYDNLAGEDIRAEAVGVLGGKSEAWLEWRAYRVLHVAFVALPDSHRGRDRVLTTLERLIAPLKPWHFGKHGHIHAKDPAMDETDLRQDVAVGILEALLSPEVTKEDVKRALNAIKRAHNRATVSSGEVRVPRRVQPWSGEEGAEDGPPCDEKIMVLASKSQHAWRLTSPSNGPQVPLDVGSLIEAAIPARCAKARLAARKKLLLEEPLTSREKGSWEMTAKPKLRAYCESRGITPEAFVRD